MSRMGHTFIPLDVPRGTSRVQVKERVLDVLDAGGARVVAVIPIERA